MFDIGWQELFILAVIALIVIGPKDLPRAIRTMTKGLRKLRTMARDLREGVDDVVREAELDDIKNSIADGDVTEAIKEATDLDFDELSNELELNDLDGDVRDEMTSAAEDLKAVTDPGASDKKADRETAEAPKKSQSAKKKTAKSGKADG